MSGRSYRDYRPHETGPSTPTTTVMAPLYEYRDVWAEEGGSVNDGQAQWSFGNGATGNIGLPVGAGWEITEIGFHADSASNSAQVSVDVTDFGSGSAVTVATIDVAVADGHGQANNMYRVAEFDPPVVVPDGAVLGFRTRSRSGSVSDARVCVRLRRQVGEYVSAVETT